MIAEVLIFLLTSTAIWLSQDEKKSWQKWSPIFGLLSQPLWFHITYQAEQWGALATSIFIAVMWCRGLKTYWFAGAVSD